MHEMSLAMTLMEQVDRCLSGFEPTARVVRLTLEAGRLRAIVPDAMRFCWEVVSAGTRAEGADLAIVEIPVNMRCDECGAEWSAEEGGFLCQACQRPARMVTGKELVLRSLEVDEG
jgi:hydrogenase nickel incorporation protein HypA/HybF